jgi:hypothetical protein
VPLRTSHRGALHRHRARAPEAVGRSNGPLRRPRVAPARACSVRPVPSRHAFETVAAGTERSCGARSAFCRRAGFFGLGLVVRVEGHAVDERLAQAVRMRVEDATPVAPVSSPVARATSVGYVGYLPSIALDIGVGVVGKRVGRWCAVVRSGVTRVVGDVVRDVFGPSVRLRPRPVRRGRRSARIVRGLLRKVAETADESAGRGAGRDPQERNERVRPMKAHAPHSTLGSRRAKQRERRARE